MERRSRHELVDVGGNGSAIPRAPTTERRDPLYDWQIFVLVIGGALAALLLWMAWTYDDMFDDGGEP